MIDYSKLPKLGQKTLLTTLVIFAVFLVIAGINLFINTVNDYRNGGPNNVYQTVSFAGEGSVNAAPDTAKAELGLLTEGKDSISVQNENSTKMNKVIDFLKNQGIKSEDIKTSAYNLHPKYDYEKGKSTLAGYVLNQSLTVTIRDLAKIGEILDGAVNNGANQINSVSLFVDKPEELKNQAREKAIAMAKEKAKNTSEMAGIRLGRIVSFSESGTGEPPIFYEALGRGNGVGGGGVAPDIQPGSQEIKITVMLTYLVK